MPESVLIKYNFKDFGAITVQATNEDYFQINNANPEADLYVDTSILTDGQFFIVENIQDDAQSIKTVHLQPGDFQTTQTGTQGSVSLQSQEAALCIKINDNLFKFIPC